MGLNVKAIEDKHIRGLKGANSCNDDCVRVYIKLPGFLLALYCGFANINVINDFQLFMRINSLSFVFIQPVHLIFFVESAAFPHN